MIVVGATAMSKCIGTTLTVTVPVRVLSVVSVAVKDCEPVVPK